MRAIAGLAALVDAALILLASGFFLGLFAALTGQAGWGRRDILIFLSAGFILAVVYFGMFTVLDGRTPGMQVRGLRVVTFEGNPPAARHRVWRAFGYVVSTGSVLLGFLWAAVEKSNDEARWATPTQIEYIGMPLLQSSFDFTAAEQEAEQLAAHASAPLGERLRAALLDAALILLASGFFLGLFAALTGQAGWGRRDILIFLSAGFILAVVYFGMFTVLDGRTPGMQVRGLRVVTFEGNPPAARHRVWRAFGYVVSTGSVLLGFLWAAVDEQQLTWHDRISGTFITDRSQL